MNTLRKRVLTALTCAALVFAAYHAWRLPFYEYAEEIYTTTKDRLFTLDWLLHLIPLLIILGLSATAIMISIAAREKDAQPKYSRKALCISPLRIGRKAAARTKDLRFHGHPLDFHDPVFVPYDLWRYPARRPF